MAQLRVHSSRDPRRAGSEYVPVSFTDAERKRAPAEPPVPVVCPVCGCTHTVAPAVLRKVERGMRTTRCDSCTVERLGYPSLTAEERPRFARWWLANFSDDQLAELAMCLGVEDASAENVARARRRLERATVSSLSASPPSPPVATRARAEAAPLN